MVQRNVMYPGTVLFLYKNIQVYSTKLIVLNTLSYAAQNTQNKKGLPEIIGKI